MRKLRVGAISRNYFNLPLWIALQEGFFAREGLAVEIELHEPIDEVTRRLHEGHFQFALEVTENAILNRERGGRLCVLGGNINRLPFSFMARPQIRGWQDMRGARIGVSSLAAGSSSLVMKLMEAHGLHHPQDYTLLPVGPILARWEMLQKGEIDAGLQGAPLNHIARDLGYTDLGDPRQTFPDFQFTSLDADSAWVRDNEATVLAFLRAWIGAHRWFHANPEGSAAIAMRETGVARRYADLAWQEFTRDAIFPRDGRASPAGVQTLIETSAQIRALALRSSARASDYIEQRHLDAAERSLGAAGDGPR
ncbi:MAG: ABC transporter substrate-binding protein [Betaproteobacteria bacterium]|jgi:ABC-type nitrate/sulfonate/bicarbonate transport system substrate-binding protein|nr:ABC transporter substrate-binding protein [Betaproteobacteria bacterium]